MKLLSIFALILSSVSAFALTPAEMVGAFSNPKKIFLVGYNSQAACVADQGEWDAENELCLFPASDDVTVSLNKGKFHVAVEVVGSNAHMCSFEGIAKRVGNKVVASAKGQSYENEQWVEAVCSVTVAYKNKNQVTVSTNGKCESFCGMRAHMEFTAKR